MSHDVILVPLKRFDIAKVRLRHSGVADVTLVARNLAIEVLEACRPRPVIVIGESEEIANFARDRGVESFESEAPDLNEAVSLAYRSIRDRYNRVIIAHGDLRYPAGLGSFVPEEGITVYTDHRGTGTNVLTLPTGLDFRFGYGPGSAQHHVDEARRLDTPSKLITDSNWRFDVDEFDDLG